METRATVTSHRILFLNTLAFTICFAVWMFNGVFISIFVDSQMFKWSPVDFGWTLAIPVLIISGFFFLFFRMVRHTCTYVFFPDFILGYLAYISLQYKVYKFETPGYGAWRKLLRNHRVHHNIGPCRCYGASPRLRDFVFGTITK